MESPREFALRRRREQDRERCARENAEETVLRVGELGIDRLMRMREVYVQWFKGQLIKLLAPARPQCLAFY